MRILREIPSVRDYLWEEIALPVPYSADAEVAERILLEAARRNAVPATEVGGEVLEALRRRYFMVAPDAEPRVFFRLTDYWLELTLRFVVRDHGIREVKDAMARGIINGLRAAAIPVASTTIEVVGAPLLPVQTAQCER